MSFFSSFASPSKSPIPTVPPLSSATMDNNNFLQSAAEQNAAALSTVVVGMSEAERADLFNAVCTRVMQGTTTLSRGQMIIPRTTGIPLPLMSAEEWQVKRVMDSCGFKTCLSMVAGAGFGVVFGLFTAAVDPNITGTETPTTRLVWQEMKSRMASYSKNFAIIGAMFACSECVIETHRAKDDWCNSPLAGAVTGGLIGLRTGVGGAVLGGTGFAIFSLAIDYYMKS